MSHSILRTFRHGLLTGFLALTCIGLVRAADTPAKTTPAVSASTNAAPAAVTNAAPVEQSSGITITTDDDDDTMSNDKAGAHTSTIHLGGNHGGDSIFDHLQTILIPLASIVATFGTPILIVFFICYYRFKRRSENLALAREYLNKGLPVPPQLLDESQRNGLPATPDTETRGCSDLSRGFKWTFAGLGVALALYITSPHSTTWGWGMIPIVIGIGFLISGALQTRLERSKDALPPSKIPPVEPRR
jgi:Domain of unknown function (DUF6249)